MSSVIRTYSLIAELRVQTGSGDYTQKVQARGETLEAAFKAAQESLDSIIRPALVGQDAALRQIRESEK